MSSVKRLFVEKRPGFDVEARHMLADLREKTERLLPQARGIVLPPLVGQYLSLIKDTSIVSMIGMSELMHQGQAIVDRIGQPVVIYALVAVLYFIVCFPLSRWVQHHQTRSQFS